MTRTPSLKNAFKAAQAKRASETKRKDAAALRSRRAPTAWGSGNPGADFGTLKTKAFWDSLEK